MIKPTTKVIAADESSNSVRFYFQEYQKGATYYNNGTRIDFVTDGKALYVCAIDTVVTTADKIEDQPNLLKILAEGKPGRDGAKGERGLPGETPTISARFDGTQMIIYADGRRIATSTDLVGPSWKPKLVGNTITWEKTRNDESPKPIDLDDLKPDDYKPILLRTNSDNTKRSDEESGPANFIQWKYEGDAEWNNLISISELMNLTLAGVSIWKNEEDGKYHFGHKEVVNARYTATHEGRQIISDVVLGDVLFDAGPIPMTDHSADIALINAKLDELQNAINRIPDPYELTAAKIADALGYTPGHEVDLNDVKLKIDGNKMLQISRDGGRNWEEVGITCECNIAETTGVPVFRVFVDGKQYDGTDYQIRIEGVGTYNATDSMPSLNIGQEYIAYAIKNGYEGSSIKFTFNKSDIRLDLTKIDDTVYYTVGINCTPAEANITVDGKAYSEPIKVVAGSTIVVSAYLDGYKDYRKSYVINENKNITISLEEIVFEEDNYCTVTITSINPSNAKVYYGQEEVHVGDTFNIAKGSSMHFKGDAVSGYKALDKDYRVYYADTQNIDIVFDPVEEIDLDGYCNVTFTCNVPDATITVNAIMSGKDPLIVNGSVTDFYLLESVPQTIKVKKGIMIITTAIADGYYNTQSVDTITSDTTINLELDLKSKEYYGDRYLIFRDIKDENGNILDPSDAELILQGESGETGAQSKYSYSDIINKPLEVSGPWRVTAIVRKPGYKVSVCYEGVVEGNVDVNPELVSVDGHYLDITFLKYFNNGTTDYLDHVWTDDSNVIVYMGKNNVSKGYQIYLVGESSGTMWVSHSDTTGLYVDVLKPDGTAFATTSFDYLATFGIHGHSSVGKGEVGTVTITATETDYDTSPVIGEITIHIRNDYDENLEPTISTSSNFVEFAANGGDQETGINYLYFASMPTYSIENENDWFNAEVYADGTRNMLKVTVDENTGAAREGTFKLIATYEEQRAELVITVSQEGASVVPVEVESVSLNKSTLSLEVGDTETLTATVSPENATDKTVTWSSDTPSVATVSNGKVSAIAEGNATITATAGSKSATCEVTVTESEEPEPTKYSISWEDDSAGDEAPINYTVKVNGSEISNGEKFEEGSEISISVDGYDGDEYDEPEIYIGGSLYNGSEFTLNDDVMCLIKWIKKIISVPVTSVGISDDTLELTVGETHNLTATVYPENATNKNVSWSSDNEGCATVDSNGKVTAVEEGMATITVHTEDGGFENSCDVTVSAVEIPVEYVSLNKAMTTLNVGESETLEYEIRPNNATNKNVNWSTSDESIATVDNGTIAAISAGEAVITITTEDGGKTASCTVTVNEPVTEEPRLVLNPSEVNLVVGTSYEDTAIAVEATIENDPTDSIVSWVIGDDTIASILVSVDSTSCTVSSIDKAGDTVLTVRTKNGLSAECPVHVQDHTVQVESVQIVEHSGQTLIIDPEVGIGLTAEISPENANYRSITWSSSNENAAVVEGNGLNANVTGVTGGLSATITVTVVSANGISHTDSCFVEVRHGQIDVESISLDANEISLAPNETYELTATIDPSTATNKDLSWSSSHPEIASVSADASGLKATVTANAIGTAIITASSDENPSIKATCNVTVGSGCIDSLQLDTADVEFLSTGGSQVITAYADNIASDSITTGQSEGSSWLTCWWNADGLHVTAEANDTTSERSCEVWVQGTGNCSDTEISSNRVTVIQAGKKDIPEAITIDEPEPTTDNVYSLYARFSPEKFNEPGANVPNLTWSVSSTPDGYASLTNPSVDGQSAELEITGDCSVEITVSTAAESISEFGELSDTYSGEFTYTEE